MEEFMKCLNRNRFAYALASCIFILLIASIAYAEKRYVIDVLVVTLRDSPTDSSRSLKSLMTGSSFTVLDEQDKFIKVETTDGTIGWLPKQYTSTTPPKALLVDELNKKVESLSNEKEKLKNKTKQLSEQLAQKEQLINEVENKYSLIKKTENKDLVDLQKQLDVVTEQYENLRKESETTIQTVKERDLLQKSNAALNQKLANLERENTSLATKQALYWFLAGGGVFILGWLIGRLSCRRQKSSLTL
jgi:SH3 domain protein